eukprot:1904485-Rhodomonas_salina.2
MGTRVSVLARALRSQVQLTDNLRELIPVDQDSTKRYRVILDDARRLTVRLGIPSADHFPPGPT